mmetsp:Transcript_16049/g.26688  ORF Transcript_16049/g.26688 Transcript_16049/m.26688 type:complete len:202 (-) Transcript_16049:1256-1861(-)
MTSCNSRVIYNFRTDVVPEVPLKMNVLSSGTYWCVTALIASWEAMPPITDAIACISAPPHRQNSWMISSETGQTPPFILSSLSTSLTNCLKTGTSASGSKPSDPGQCDRSARYACAARSMTYRVPLFASSSSAAERVEDSTVSGWYSYSRGRYSWTSRFIAFLQKSFRLSAETRSAESEEAEQTWWACACTHCKSVAACCW